MSRNRASRGAWMGGYLAMAGSAITGCGPDRVEISNNQCDDAAIGWSLDLDDLPSLPPAEFGVECDEGWGHGVETRAADAIIELPNESHHLQAHPEGGLLVVTGSDAQRWSARLGVEIAEHALLWVDESAEQLRWVRDDLRYDPPAVVWTDAGAQLWVIGSDAEDQAWMTAIDLGSGEVIEHIEAPVELPVEPALEPLTLSPAWPEVGGVWFELHESLADGQELRGLYRMIEFGQVEGPLRTRATPWSGASMTTYPTPGGGLLWTTQDRIERLDEHGALLWNLDQPHYYVVVDGQGSFLLTTVSEVEDQRHGLTLERRSLADASVLWSRVHHRYTYADTPPPDPWLVDLGYGFAARADGGYLVAGMHAYPAQDCSQQPIVWAVSGEGEVEWAHRVETCGGMLGVRGPLPGGLVGDRALVFGSAYLGGVVEFNREIDARWLQAFELGNP